MLRKICFKNVSAAISIIKLKFQCRPFWTAILWNCQQTFFPETQHQRWPYFCFAQKLYLKERDDCLFYKAFWQWDDFTCFYSWNLYSGVTFNWFSSQSRSFCTGSFCETSNMRENCLFNTFWQEVILSLFPQKMCSRTSWFFLSSWLQFKSVNSDWPVSPSALIKDLKSF